MDSRVAVQSPQSHQIILKIAFEEKFLTFYWIFFAVVYFYIILDMCLTLLRHFIDVPTEMYQQAVFKVTIERFQSQTFFYVLLHIFHACSQL